MYAPFNEFQIPTGVTSVIGSGGKTSFLGRAPARGFAEQDRLPRRTASIREAGRTLRYFF